MSSELELMANSLFNNVVPDMWKAKARHTQQLFSFWFPCGAPVTSGSMARYNRCKTPCSFTYYRRPAGGFITKCSFYLNVFPSVFVLFSYWEISLLTTAFSYFYTFSYSNTLSQHAGAARNHASLRRFLKLNPKCHSAEDCGVPWPELILWESSVCVIVRSSGWDSDIWHLGVISGLQEIRWTFCDIFVLL